MILQYFLKEKKEGFVLLIHVLLAVLFIFSKYFFIFWVYFVILFTLPQVIKSSTRSRAILFLSGYIFGLEILGRMVKASPFVPYQLGNYYMLLVFCYSIIRMHTSQKGMIGKVILLLCIPAFYLIPYENYYVYFINSFSGILCLGLAAVYFGNQRYSAEDLKNFIKIIVLPILVIALYVSIKSPSFDDIDFALGANFETTGGFGSNQVSTVFGVGACVLLLPYLRRKVVFSSYKGISIVLIALFVFRGLLTFSRGGMLGALVAVGFSFLYLNWKSRANRLRFFLQLILILGGGALVFVVTNEITGGTLSERYEGETAGTLRGDRVKNLSTITSNRSKIALAEWDIFTSHVLLGVGPGAGYKAREKFLGKSTAAHTEFTRLLAEQGLPGLFIGIIFIFYPLIRIKNSKSVEETYYIIAFFSLAVITSFHSAMRTMITPLFWALCCAGFEFPEPFQRETKIAENNKKSVGLLGELKSE